MQFDTAKPFADPVIDPTVAVQQAMRGIVHQDEQAELTVPDEHDGHRNQVGPRNAQAYRRGDHGPAMENCGQPFPR